MKLFGTSVQLKTEEILSIFAPVEGDVCFYYGRTRNGKTYGATADILNLLQRGEVVFANWQIDFRGFDERNSFWIALFRLVTFRDLFFKYSAKNFHYFDPATSAEVLVRQLNKLVNVHIFIDEGQWVLNSHKHNPDPEAQKLVLTNGHYCRSLNIISQRPQNVFKDYRSQVNFWFKFEKIWNFPVIFVKTIIEDMKDDLPEEDSEYNKSRAYFARKEIFRAYETHAMRGVNAIEHVADFEAFTLGFVQRFLVVARLFVPRRFRKDI